MLSFREDILLCEWPGCDHTPTVRLTIRWPQAEETRRCIYCKTHSAAHMEAIKEANERSEARKAGKDGSK